MLPFKDVAKVVERMSEGDRLTYDEVVHQLQEIGLIWDNVPIHFLSVGLRDHRQTLLALREARLEAAYWRQKYHKLSGEAMDNAQQHTGLLLKAALAGAFNPKEEPEELEEKEEA